MANSEQQMVNQLLTELESQTDADIVVFAATNYVEDVDDAILRSVDSMSASRSRRRTGGHVSRCFGSNSPMRRSPTR